MKTIKIETEVYEKIKKFADEQGYTLKDAVTNLVTLPVIEAVTDPVTQAVTDVVADRVTEDQERVTEKLPSGLPEGLPNELPQESKDEKLVTCKEFQEFLDYFNGPEFLGELNEYEKKVDSFLERIAKLEKEFKNFKFLQDIREIRDKISTRS